MDQEKTRKASILQDRKAAITLRLIDFCFPFRCVDCAGWYEPLVAIDPSDGKPSWVLSSTNLVSPVTPKTVYIQLNALNTFGARAKKALLDPLHATPWCMGPGEAVSANRKIDCALPTTDRSTPAY